LRNHTQTRASRFASSLAHSHAFPPDFNALQFLHTQYISKFYRPTRNK